ncbi:hypothetical protein BJX96DRAFT_156708 [Aspergillus floccosus]
MSGIHGAVESPFSRYTVWILVLCLLRHRTYLIISLYLSILQWADALAIACYDGNDVTTYLAED